VWSKKFERKMRATPFFTKVVAYAIQGKDDVLQKFAQLPGNTLIIKENNQERRKKKDRFETACEAFIGQLQLAVSAPVLRQLEADDDYEGIIAEIKVREMWDLIEKLIVEKNNSGPQKDSSTNYFDRIKQERGENFDDYTERFQNVVDELNLLGETVTDAQQRKRFLNGFNPKFEKIRMKLAESMETSDLSVRKIADKASELVKVQKNNYGRTDSYPPDLGRRIFF
jgi:hypothetical protein